MKIAPQEEKIETEETNATFVIPEPVNNLNSTFTKNEAFSKPLKSPRRIGHRYTPIKSKRFALKGDMIFLSGTFLTFFLKSFCFSTI